MLSGRSIPLGRILGIRIGVHPTWFLILFLVIFALSESFGTRFGEGGGSFAAATLAAALFFVSVLLHELGHSVAAVRNGIEIAGIDLWLFGGVAKMRRDPPSPGLDLWVAVAGPLVTLVLAVLFFGLGALLVGPEAVVASDFGLSIDDSLAAAVVGQLFAVNVVLLLFNLVPGFPLDGGRIVRALAWRVTGDRLRATRFAAALGRGFAGFLSAVGVVLIVVGGSLVQGIYLLFLGLFLNQAARSAEFQTRVTSRIEGLRVADVMDREPVAVGAGLRLDSALDEFFLRYQWPWFPVVDAAGRFVGLLRREQVEEVPEDRRAEATVDQVMERGGEPAYDIGMDQPLESVLGVPALRQVGALMAVDADGVLRGVLSVEQVRRALRDGAPVL